MPAPPTFQMVVNAATISSVGGSGRGVSTTWWPAASSARTAAATAAAHAGSTSMPSMGEAARTPIRSPVGGSAARAPANDVAGVGGDHHAAGS
jgi:hypothetical protein